jgi:Zinc carboxypeptidase
MVKACATFVLFLALNALFAQETPKLSYFLPNVSYNPATPTPAAFFGFEIGESHVSHDQLAAYMRELDRVSDRISLTEHGRTHEKRPLYCLAITAPENHARLDDIRRERAKLVDPAQSGSVDVRSLPAVNYMGYSIHGNEASGSNAALAVAYYLAAAQTPEVETLLKNTVILFDPCFNPDGLQRFSGWVNSRRSQNTVSDPADDEYNEYWPRGRYNHYWFDLNRDWLVTQQPESVGRVRIFQDWHPNILTDHHEMGSNSTFFFQPGVPSRVNPITPARNQELTGKIAGYHATALSEQKIQFYSGENYDDFYYGKGSTYPDINGCVGILFEQASSRGSAQETENGLLTFAYSIRNQVITSFSTLKALSEMRVELNEYLRDFYKSALDEAKKDETKGYLFSVDDHDKPGLELIDIFKRHRIDVFSIKSDATVNGLTFKAANTFWVPSEQAQYRMVKAIFNRQTAFQDSIFYDISAWTLPDAFGLKWTPVKARDFKPGLAGDALTTLPAKSANIPAAKEVFAFAIDANAYELPQIIARLQKDGVNLKLAQKSFSADGHDFKPGTLIIPVEHQKRNAADLQKRLLEVCAQKVGLNYIGNGLTPTGPDLGSESYRPLRAPKVLLLTGEGVNPEPAGEIWHLLDTRYGLSVSHLETGRFNASSLSKYNVLILSEGTYTNISAEKVRQFATDGGTVIAMGSALRWLRSVGLAAIEFKNTESEIPGRRPYTNLFDDRAARRLPGAIFEAELDLSHPLCYGYERDRLPMFLSDTTFLETAKNPYATPAVFSKTPLLAGYLHAKHKPLIANSAAVLVSGLGRGRIICFVAEPNFRAFWYGTNRMFANAVFFGSLIHPEATERKR